MALEVLKAVEDIAQARREMRARKVSQLPAPWACRLLERARLARLLPGDFVKSWDVWRTALFLEQNLSRDALIIDLGAYNSEILAVLDRLNFTRLHGVDLNPRLKRQPYRKSITYTVCDFFHTPFDPGLFAAVTSISAIEHGHDLPKLFAEVSRLLRPGGYFLCSTDYWPEKIHTNGIKIFNMSWTIFSKEELSGVFGAARAVGLEPVGALDFGASKPVIHHAGKAYTFAWFALKKS